MTETIRGSDASGLLYIPTHRTCVNVVRQRSQEVRWAQQVLGADVRFAIIGSSQVQEPELIAAAARELPDQIIYYFDPPRIRALIAALCRECGTSTAQFVTDYLLPRGLSYGTGPNVAALLSAVLGASVVHRRDSDVFIDPERPISWPIELEIETLGGAGSRNPIKVCGTSTFGSPPINRQPLITAGFDTAIQYQMAAGAYLSVQDAVDELEQYFYIEPHLRYQFDAVHADSAGRVEMEVCAIRTLQWQIPEMCVDIIGSDYMILELARRTNASVMFHNRKQLHLQDASRTVRPNGDYPSYSVRDVSSMQLGVIMRHAVSSLHGQFPTASSLANALAQAVEAVGNKLQFVRVECTRVLNEASRRTSPSSARELSGALLLIRELDNSIEQNVLQSIHKYIQFLRNWDDLIVAARRITDAELRRITHLVAT